MIHLAKQSLFTVVAMIAIVALGISVAQAAPIGISASGLSPTPDESPEPDPSDLISATVGGTTYNTLSFGTATTSGSTGDLFYSENSTPPASKNAALSSSLISDAVANVEEVDFMLGEVVTAGSSSRFFMYEVVVGTQSGDSVNVSPLDAGGNPIGSWTLSIGAGDYGAVTPAFDTFGTSTDISGRGTSFTLADFTGDVGILTDVAGLRFEDNIGGVNWDPIFAGVMSVTAAVPEPATAGMVLLGMLAGAGCRRRQRRGCRK